MTATALLPLDFSLLEGFSFGQGAGNYQDRRACVMSALYLVTQIAEGKTTLADVLEKGDDALELKDSVTYVAPILRDFCIQRNDRGEDEAERRVWAMGLMPRLVGTAFTGVPDSPEEAAYNEQLRIVSRAARDSAKTEAAKQEARLFIETLNTSHLSTANKLMSTSTSTNDAIPVLDRMIEAILKHLGK